MKSNPLSLISETEAELIEAYLKVASKIGASNVTLERVAQQAKVSFSKVQYHFGGDSEGFTEKAAYYVGISAERFVSETMRNSLKQDPKANLLELYVKANFDWAQEKLEHAKFWVYFLYVSSFNGAQSKNQVEFMEQGRIRIQSLLEQAIGKGQIPRVKKPELLSKKIQCLIVGSVVLAFTGGKEGNVNEYRHITSQMLSDLLQSHINRKVE